MNGLDSQRPLHGGLLVTLYLYASAVDNPMEFGTMVVLTLPTAFGENLGENRKPNGR